MYALISDGLKLGTTTKEMKMLFGTSWEINNFLESACMGTGTHR